MLSKTLLSAIALATTLVLPALSAGSTSVMAGTSRAAEPQAITNFNSKKVAIKKSVRKVARSSAGSKTTSRQSGHKNAAIVAKVKAHARAAGVPVATALAVVRQESGFRPHVTGSAGEIGLMQLKCQTARGIGYTGSCKGLYNPDTNLRIGMRYLRKALNRGSVGFYNAGIHAKRLPKAAKKYANSVAANEG